MNSNITYRQSLPQDQKHIDNVVESLFYQMLSLELENDIDRFLDLVDFPQDSHFTRLQVKQKLYYRVNIVAIQP